MVRILNDPQGRLTGRAIGVLAFVAVCVAAGRAAANEPAPRDPRTAAWTAPFGGKSLGETFRPARETGLPLGGPGSGRMAFNLTGSFGPWETKPGRFENFFPPGAGFLVREAPPGDARTRALMTENAPEGWSPLRPGQGTYSVLYPMGWIDFNSGFHNRVALRFFSPALPTDDAPAGLPAALFIFDVENPKDYPIETALMFAFPNLQEVPETGDDGSRLTPTPGPVEGRMDAETGASLVTLQAMGDGWSRTLAVSTAPGAALSFRTQWDPAGPGIELRRDFQDDGVLTGGEPQRESPGAAVAAAFTLLPGARREVAFAMTWKKTAADAAGLGSPLERNGGMAALLALETRRRQAWEKEIRDWQAEILDSTRPMWLKRAVLNGLAPWFPRIAGLLMK